MPRPSGHCLVGMTEVPWWAVGEAEVAQDVGGAVAFCTGNMDMGVRPRPVALAHPPPRAAHTHTHTGSKQAMLRRALTLAQPLCVPLHTRAAGHLGSRGPCCHVLSRSIEQQCVAVQCPWAGVAVGMGRKEGCCWQPDSAILGRTPQPAPPNPGVSDSGAVLATQHPLEDTYNALDMPAHSLFKETIGNPSAVG